MSGRRGGGHAETKLSPGFVSPVDLQRPETGPLGSVSVVVAQHAAQPLVTSDLANRSSDFLACDDQTIVQPLMIPFLVIVPEELVYRRP